MPSLVIIEQEIKEKHGGGAFCVPQSKFYQNSLA